MCLSWVDVYLSDLLILYEFVTMTVYMSMFKSDTILQCNLVSHIRIVCQRPFPNTQISLGLSNSLGWSYSCVIVLSWSHPSLISVLQYLCQVISITDPFSDKSEQILYEHVRSCTGPSRSKKRVWSILLDFSESPPCISGSDEGEREEMVAALDTITNCQRKAQHCAIPPCACCLSWETFTIHAWCESLTSLQDGNHI